MLLTSAADLRAAALDVLDAAADCSEAFWELTNKPNLAATRTSTLEQQPDEHSYNKKESKFPPRDSRQSDYKNIYFFLFERFNAYIFGFQNFINQNPTCWVGFIQEDTIAVAFEIEVHLAS